MQESMNSFIYVFDKDLKDKLCKLSYPLLKEDKQNGIYVFVNIGACNFASFDGKYTLSNTLTF